MKKILKILGLAFAALLVAFLVIFFGFAPDWIAARLNTTLHRPPYKVSDKAIEMHQKLLVADMHADSLLWDFDILEGTEYSQVDLPKMMEGNIALQAFTVVTKTPRGINIEQNDDKSDSIFWLSLAQMQPLENLSSLTKRALYQAAQLHAYAEKSGGKLIIIRSRQDLKNFLDRRKSEKVIGGWLGIEGAHALDGKPENVDTLFDAGYRMISPSHFFDTEMGGSAHGMEKYGLTEKGLEMIKRMEAKGIFVDLAHASKQAIDDILAIAARPVIISHTGVKGTCDNNRNLSDEQLRAIAKTGGVIGIGFWDTATCGDDAKAIAKAIRHTANIAGIDHVGLGSDFDGAVKEPFDASGMALITEALMNEGFSEEEIAKIMGGNTIRLLLDYLPE